MSGLRFRVGVQIGRFAAALAVACGTMTVVSLALGADQADASTAGCGMTLANPQSSGALGSIIFQVEAVPQVAGQGCNATVTLSGTIATAGGTRPTNVAANGNPHTITVTFLPGQPPPVILWQWSPHCADPATLPYEFLASSPTAGAVSLFLGGATPCNGFGTTNSTLVPPAVLVGNPSSYAGIAPTPGNLGYWLVTQGGLQSAHGDAPNLSMPFSNAPVVGVTDSSAGGYWWAATDGGVFAVGGAPFFGSVGGVHLNAPIVGIASTPDQGGYWLVAADGGVFGFGDARFHGSVPGVLPPGQSLNAPVVGIAASPDGGGYWLVSSDGGVFAFGDAHFEGSMGATHLNRPVVGIAGNTLGGYRLVASDGGVFAFDALFEGSLGSTVLNAPITGLATTDDGRGYWMVAGDGGVFAFGDAPFWGSAA